MNSPPLRSQNEGNNSGIPLISTDSAVYFVDKNSPGVSVSMREVDDSATRMRAYRVVGTVTLMSIALVPTNCCGR